MKILGIETSCDETGIALYDGKANQIVFEALYSQAEEHDLYGGVDYDSSIDDKSTIRSAVGFGVDLITPVGPLNFSYSAPLTKASSDKTESFRFNLGTTF